MDFLEIPEKGYVAKVKAKFPIGEISRRFFLEDDAWLAALEISEEDEFEFAYYQLFEGKWSVVTYNEETLLDTASERQYFHQELCEQTSVASDARTIYNDYTKVQIPRLKALREELTARNELTVTKFDSLSLMTQIADGDSTLPLENSQHEEGAPGDPADAQEFGTAPNFKESKSYPFLYLLAFAGLIGLFGLLFQGLSNGGGYTPSGEYGNSNSNQSPTSELPSTDFNLENDSGEPGSFVTCEDGTTSNSGGRQGACSWHGGVSP